MRDVAVGELPRRDAARLLKRRIGSAKQKVRVTGIAGDPRLGRYNSRLPVRALRQPQDGCVNPEDVWNAFTGHIGESPPALNVGERERNELVVIVAGLKKDIVNMPRP